MKSFKTKVAVITGAGSGIGRALAIQLATEGASLALTDLNVEGLKETVQRCESVGAKVFSTVSNAAKLEEVKSFVQNVITQYGRVDLIFNNAGIALGKKTLLESNYEEWEKIMGVNLWGVIYGTKEFLPHLLKQPEAAVINISSIFGLAGIPEQTPYCTTKFAVRGFSESLRGELENTNVQVYCVHPGGINTNIAEDALKEAQGNPQKLKEVTNFKKMLVHSPEKAAHVILSAVKKQNYKVLIGEEAYVFDAMTRIFPLNYNKIIEFGLKKLIKK
ncbi:MAG TPA: SDR family oxidoreductase [Chitinophagales bacterium]|nr:SDR family oxidoreductase [Chitinophagales bacterium]